MGTNPTDGDEPVQFVVATVSAREEADATPGLAMGAVVSGVLTVNARGCFEIEGFIVVAPHGSRVTYDPVGIDMPGTGAVLLGSDVYASGAYTNPSYAAGSEVDLVEQWGRYLTPDSEGFVILNKGMTTSRPAKN